MYEIYYSYKDYPKAVETLENLLKLDPYNNDIKNYYLHYISRTIRQTKRKVLYEEMLLLNPQDKEIQTELIKIYFRDNDTEKAFDNFRKMLGKRFSELLGKNSGRRNILQYDTGTICNRNFKVFFWIWTAVIRINGFPYYYLGTLEIIKSKGNNYKDYYSKAIEYTDTSREVYSNIGLTYFQKGEIQWCTFNSWRRSQKYPDDFRLNYIKGLTLQGGNQESKRYSILKLHFPKIPLI